MSKLCEKKYISVIIPVYNSSHSLHELYERLVHVLITQATYFEIIFVEDCSGDNSWKIICDLVHKDDRIRGLRMNRNYGQHNALLAGIRNAEGDLIITLDDDLQHLPEELPKLIIKIDEGYDVVYGSPVQEQQDFFRNLSSQITKLILKHAIGIKIARHVSALRIFRTHLRDAFVSYKNPFVNIDVLLTWSTTQFGFCKVKYEPRKYGKSGYNIRKLITHTINMITGFSIVPLKIVSCAGICFAMFGCIILVYVFVYYFFITGVVPGFSFLASIISIFAGAQLLALGIIGEYLGRMHQHTMARPAYFLCEKIGKNNNMKKES